MRRIILVFAATLCIVLAGIFYYIIHTSCDKEELAQAQGPSVFSDHLDIYTLDHTNKLAPTIVFIHGGAWIGGDKSHWGYKQINTFRDNQFISVSINYPTTQEHSAHTLSIANLNITLQTKCTYKHPAHILSIAKTLQWIQDSIQFYGGDPHNIILIGHSAGAHLAALAVTNQKYILEHTRFNLSNIKLVCLIDGGSYLTLPTGQPDTQYADAFYQVVGSDQKNWEDFTPGNHITSTKQIPPMFLIYSNISVH